jgi:hypothetical protein
VSRFVVRVQRLGLDALITAVVTLLERRMRRAIERRHSQT